MSDLDLCSAMSSEDVVVSVYFELDITTKGTATFDCRALDYCYTDWNDFDDHIKDVPWNYMFRLGTFC